MAHILSTLKVQLGTYQKNISQEWSRVKNLSCVSCAAWNVFPLNLLLWPFTKYVMSTNKELIKCFYYYFQVEFQGIWSQTCPTVFRLWTLSSTRISSYEMLPVFQWMVVLCPTFLKEIVWKLFQTEERWA